MKQILFLASVLALAACERREPTTSQKPSETTSPTNPTPAAPPQATTPAPANPEITRTEPIAPAAHDRWQTTWDRFSSSKERKLESDDHVFERAADRGITVWRRTQAVAANAKEKVADATVLAGVKAGLAASPDARAHEIDVDVKDNVVHLKGEVGSAREAGEAVRVALGIPGVDKVVSHLTY